MVRAGQPPGQGAGKEILEGQRRIRSIQKRQDTQDAMHQDLSMGIFFSFHSNLC